MTERNRGERWAPLDGLGHSLRRATRGDAQRLAWRCAPAQTMPDAANRAGAAVSDFAHRRKSHIHFRWVLRAGPMKGRGAVLARAG
jgi:hypothetical protein